MVQIREISEAQFGPDDSSAPAADVRRIAAACDAADGVDTLNEQARLLLKNRGLREARLWLGAADDGGEPTGFALLHGSLLDLAVHPDGRRRGVGTALARAAVADLERVEAWSHGDHPAAARLAERFGVPRERELTIMRRPTADPLPAVRMPDGVVVRGFTPADEAAVLAVNAAAFAHHPEQGDLTLQDFRERQAESWFDPAGLFLAVPAAAPTPEHPDHDLLGFHWTKVHRDEQPPHGEVYVVAVNPKAAGRGIGSMLTNVGLRHLADEGLGEVILYVDGDNEPAIALYSGLGFAVDRTEVQYRGPLPR
jgi:mycothiol synthase